MRPTTTTTTTLLSLLAAVASAPVALAAPIPGTSGLSAEWERRLAAVAGRTSLLVQTLTPEAAAALADETNPSAIVIDNHHYSPSGDIAPSAVLSTPRPIVTTYLMGLGPKADASSRNSKDQRVSASVPIRIHNTHEGVEVVIIDADVETALEAAKAIAGTPDATAPIITPATIANEEGWDATEPGTEMTLPDVEIPASLLMEARFGHPQKTGASSYSSFSSASAAGAPCRYAQMRRDYNDMMVISLVAVFLLVIVAVELWDSSDEETKHDEDAPVGAIKLADDPASEKQPLSVQASPMALPSTHPRSAEADEA
ncbi:hypothetical protein SCUCBS95973_009909 [Sporothrix curviconia]|uniref:Protein BIG1 n=1 Tax=Sporothrix curviconia TaxID=1260050 RepID=A0ABP0CYR9_9PEZI